MTVTRAQGTPKNGVSTAEQPPARASAPSPAANSPAGSSGVSKGEFGAAPRGPSLHAAVRAPIANLPPRIAKPSNPATFEQPRTVLDLAKISFSAYGSDPTLSKIAIYDAGLSKDGRPIRMVVLTGTESSGNTNRPLNWGAAGTGASTDFEQQVLAAIQDSVRRGDIPKNAVIDLVGHSLGSIVANNLSGHTKGAVTAQTPDGETVHVPIRNVIGFGTPLPAVWSESVHYHQWNVKTDVVSNVPEQKVGGRALGQWASDPGGPNSLSREETTIAPRGDFVDGALGGHLRYATPGAGNPLQTEKLGGDLDYQSPLRLTAAYANPATPVKAAAAKPGKPEDIKTQMFRALYHAFSTSDQRAELNSSYEAAFNHFHLEPDQPHANQIERALIYQRNAMRLGDIIAQVAGPLIHHKLTGGR